MLSNRHAERSRHGTDPIQGVTCTCYIQGAANELEYEKAACLTTRFCVPAWRNCFAFVRSTLYANSGTKTSGTVAVAVNICALTVHVCNNVKTALHNVHRKLDIRLFTRPHLTV